MKTIFTFSIFSFFLLTTISLNAQITTATPWTWMQGSNEPLHAGVYGNKGVADAANTPGAREFSITWTDASGNFWLFGGYGYAAASFINSGDLNDLWKYTPASNQWTWVAGDSTINEVGIYGTKGTPAATNKPGARRFSFAWKDATGNLWFFGGYGYATGAAIGHLDDVWKYNPSSNEWTWVTGGNTTNTATVFGTKGTPDVANTPGARYGGFTWADASGNLWLFGGVNLLVGFLNDLWKYNPVTNEWTWVKGDNLGGKLGIYGAQGTPAAANNPGGRYEGFSWADAAGNFWLFGGDGGAAVGYGYLSDLWKYTPSTNEWTWIKGTNMIDQTGIYGTQGTADAANNPGGRFEGSSWMDASGNLWLFGGGGYAGGIMGNLNDLWQYNIAANSWTWVKGSNTVLNSGIYGTQGTADAANRPGVRDGSMSWTDASDNLWLFGGEGSGAFGTGLLNDLWMLGGSGTVPVTLLNISAQVVQRNAVIAWQTAQELNTSSFIIERSPDSRNFFSIGSVAAAGNSQVTKKYSFKDPQVLQGTTFYRVKMTDKDGNVKYSSVVKVTADAVKNTIAVFPNPVTTVATINISTGTEVRAGFTLYDYKGSLVASRQVTLLAGINSFGIDMSKLSKGMYTAVVTGAGEPRFLKIVKE